MPEEELAPESTALQSCNDAKARGNKAFGAADLETAKECYTEALQHWDSAVDEIQGTNKLLAEGARVGYGKGRFGVVMSVFPLMQEYFLKDLETDQPVWAGGQVGINLERFGRQELRFIETALFDLRLAVAQNLAAVHLKQEDFAEAVRWANAALAMNGKAPKALMRKGAALLRSDRASAAVEPLVAAAEALPTDKELAKLVLEAQKASPNDAQWVCAAGCLANCAGLLCVPSLTPPPAKLTSAAFAEAGTKKKECTKKECPDKAVN
mmetsp:Transcript_68355/g.164014  ORF Transcript_68355/g.164014 Transcript_68355/m.164014 type:complete len:267 (+) Transcript_68355:89-889(+)|eukprot:CAMPEP_0178411836 /NCGR_PEP_ID=MMETSP0689_2-20121128/21700_1 /TAXON_ID=160604 /ORGANISM="Amphidinium massartii, Strain CS-259" /LENGTH=266 /DNA_ID=CAMNT_0020033055 /DNA_START=52 /DNA_END=852 /DNA_ORIENTATION=-